MSDRIREQLMKIWRHWGSDWISSGLDVMDNCILAGICSRRSMNRIKQDVSKMEADSNIMLLLHVDCL